MSYFLLSYLCLLSSPDLRHRLGAGSLPSAMVHQSSAAAAVSGRAASLTISAQPAGPAEVPASTDCAGADAITIAMNNGKQADA
jgi:hypothetical protein